MSTRPWPLVITLNSRPCRHDQALGLENNLVYAQRLGGTTSVLEAGHDVMFSEPELLAHVLMERLLQH